MADRYTELLKKITDGKATATDKVEFANLLQSSSKEELEKEKEEKFNRVKAVIEKEGLTFTEVIQSLKGASSKIFSWVDSQGKDHHRYEGELGKYPEWTKQLKDQVTKAEALKMATGEKGKAFVEKVYG